MSINQIEVVEQYEYAYKKAKKQMFLDRIHSKQIYLPALDEIVNVDECTKEDVGQIDVPAELIVGTKNVGRKVSFASNFMPILKNSSEFAMKWKNVCKYHLSDEGINDPPKVYEYYGKFYVEEGNKRVSVLKSYDAVLIPCEVTRIIPSNDNSYEYNLYNEFLNYYKLSNLYSIQFKKLGYYTKLQKLLLFDEKQIWERQDQIRLIGIYERLSSMLKNKKIKVYYPDALVVLMEIYGYNLLREMSDKQLSKAIDESKIKLINNKAHYSILCVSDEEDEALWNGYNARLLKEHDFIISAGDLKPAYLEYLVTISNKPLFYVHGNHDDIEPEGCTCIDDDVYVYDGIRILGLGGSYKYKENAKYMYTEQQMQKRIRKLRRKIAKVGGIDIVVSHAPIKGYGDLDDYAHQGFECFKKLITTYHPKYFLFGHVHSRYDANYKTFYELEGTQIINISGKQKIIF